MNLKCGMVIPDWLMLNGLNATQRRKNGMMEVREGGVVGDVRELGWCCGDGVMG